MFRNGDDGYGGGGFDTSSFGTGETPQADKKGPARSEHIVPVTARQVIQSSDNGLTIGNSNFNCQMVKLIGIVKKINRSSVKVTYTLEDNTGSIEGVHWLEGDNDDNFVVPVVENTYCVMIGSVRSGNPQYEKRHIMVFNIFPITDLNEVTAHALQIVHISLKAEDLMQQTTLPVTSKQEMMSTYGGMDTSMGGGGSDYSAGFTLNPQQQRVLKAVAQNTTEAGASVDEIMNSLTVKMPMKEIEKILEFLSSEGHVYSTSDDKHYRATDGMM